MKKLVNMSFLVFQSLFFSACSKVIITEKLQKDPEVQLEIYSLEKNNGKMVIVMPPTGGSTYIDHYYSKKIAEKGFYVLRVMDWKRHKTRVDDLDVHRRHLLRAQEVVNSLIENYDFEPYSIMGTSLGGIHSAVSLGLIDRFKKSVLITSGAPAFEIIAHSNQKDLKKLRESRFDMFGFKSIDEYEKELKKTNIPNALENADKLKNKENLFIWSSIDETVPAKNQKDLLEAMAPKKVIEYKSNHFRTIIKAWLFNSSEVVKFLTED